MNTSERMSADKDEEQWVHPLLLGKHKQPNPFGKCSSTFSNEGQHERPHGPAIPLLTLRPRDGVYIASGEWTSRFRAASHAIANKTKKNNPHAHQQKNGKYTVSVQRTDCCASGATKDLHLLLFATIQRKLTNMMLKRAANSRELHAVSCAFS